MYTQCAKCETVFKLSAEVLRAAGGQVRCGRCGEIFNALTRLSEDSNSFVSDESALDLEARADSILESAMALKVAQAVAKEYEDFAPPGVEIAQLRILDWTEEDQMLAEEAEASAGSDEGMESEGSEFASAELEDTELEDTEPDISKPDVSEPGISEPESTERESAAGPLDAEAGPLDAEEEPDDTTMEFTLPPGELDRIFIESKARRMKSTPMPVPPTQDEPAPDATDIPATAADSGMPAEPASMQAPPAHEAQPESWAGARRAREHPSGLEVSDDVRRDMLAGLELELQPARVEPGSVRDHAGRRPFILWLCGAIVAVLLLAAQIVHRNAEWFAAQAHGPLGAVVRVFSGAMGAPLAAPASLSAYQLRQWGVTGDPNANGTLRVRASILNSAVQLQPYPLLRVTLADRFGKRIGTRDFEPAEYLGRPIARLLAPGERVDATLNILDPGKTAEGFEIDVCLRGAAQKIHCASDAAAQVKP